jgi:hypothetical protein
MQQPTHAGTENGDETGVDCTAEGHAVSYPLLVVRALKARAPLAHW